MCVVIQEGQRFWRGMILKKSAEIFGVSVKTKVPKNATIPPDATIKKILIYIIYIIF